MAESDEMTRMTSPTLKGDGDEEEITLSWSEDEDDLEEAEIVDDDELFMDEDPESFPPEPETAPQAPRDPLTTATLAEIYLAQGFYDQALQIYEELYNVDPDNDELLCRITDIELLRSEAHFTQEAFGKTAPEIPTTSPSFRTEAAASRETHGERVVAALEGVLDNIQRRRQCH